ncbi:MAG: hypothetical protein L0Y61_02020, partial [Epsilonproteobacteria bacterium]|nr:hypothetical protein [Campylobacterota bacterium]
DIQSMTEKKNQIKLLWFQAGGALNFITAVPHCGRRQSFFKVISSDIQLEVTTLSGDFQDPLLTKC